MKTKEELNALKKEVETLNKKLKELSEDELKLISGGHHDSNNCVIDALEIGGDDRRPRFMPP